MTRQRKNYHAPEKALPSKPLIEIAEDEQWRLINESGLLKTINGQELKNTPSREANEPLDNDISPLVEEVFNVIILVVPFSFLLLLMEILIHQQYGKEPSMQALIDRMAPSVPLLSIFIFYTTRYRKTRLMQLGLFALSVSTGSRMIFLINRASWLVNMRQCPPLATLWIYAVFRLDLIPAVLSLVGTGAFVYVKGLKIKF